MFLLLYTILKELLTSHLSHHVLHLKHFLTFLKSARTFLENTVWILIIILKTMQPKNGPKLLDFDFLVDVLIILHIINQSNLTRAVNRLLSHSHK